MQRGNTFKRNSTELMCLLKRKCACDSVQTEQLLNSKYTFFIPWAVLNVKDEGKMNISHKKQASLGFQPQFLPNDIITLTSTSHKLTK